MDDVDRRGLFIDVEFGVDSPTFRRLLSISEFPPDTTAGAFVRQLDELLNIVDWHDFNMIDPTTGLLKDALNYTGVRLRGTAHILILRCYKHPITGEMIARERWSEPCICSATPENMELVFDLVYSPPDTDVCIFDSSFSRFVTICHDGVVRFTRLNVL